MRILVTRTDAIGDVVLTLPLCGFLKRQIPGTTICILARTYTKAVVDVSDSIDEFLDYERLMALPADQQVQTLKSHQFDAIIHLVTLKHMTEMAYKAGIGIRIGTWSRPYHWLQCNRLVWLRRRQSDLHEATLHFKLMKPLVREPIPKNLWEYYNLTNFAPLPDHYLQLQNTDKFTIILHPLSNKNALEWSLESFSELIGLLDPERYRIFITGSEKEQIELEPWVKSLPSHVIDLTGQLPLPLLITFINGVDGLLAGSTGPMHLAAACGINTLGLFPNYKPKNAGRWGPLGPRTDFIETQTDTLDSVSPEAVFTRIQRWKKMERNNG
ncbi:ADP-heptose:LPS heptosyltransferase [Dyadobacter jejuensis]|uniref:ADP-heptose:LPS heptosyltransferase n=1 Tax=Dyadobacter jejuensis TaxID=1082580 RepID=A0A316ARB0_9BACT|nr:glycosyltransferase family 9 protein [Dyadobacter jejuensis]PWJ59916.1 ADP-heptose:LPS heptosyltransferase [Dyadobacter jejuensis]